MSLVMSVVYRSKHTHVLKRKLLCRGVSQEENVERVTRIIIIFDTGRQDRFKIIPAMWKIKKINSLIFSHVCNFRNLPKSVSREPGDRTTLRNSGFGKRRSTARLIRFDPTRRDRKTV